MRRKIDPQIKARVALEALAGEKTITEIASQYKVHPNLVRKLKAELLEGAPKIFQKSPSHAEQEKDQKIDELHRLLGEAQADNQWLKKKCREWNL